MEKLLQSLTTFLTALSLTRLVDVYNLTVKPNQQITKFADRKTAVARVLKIMTSWTENGKISEGPIDPVLAYNNFFSDFAVLCAKGKDGFQLPTPEPIPVKATKATRTPGETGKEKQTIPPFFNLRCTTCGFFVKVSAPSHARGRVVCPVDGGKHGILKTAEERGEKRGRF